LKTYRDFQTSLPIPGTIVEAARAISLPPRNFEPIVMMDDVKYADEGTGWNNATELAIEEAWSDDRPIGCVVSIGAGLEAILPTGSPPPNVAPLHHECSCFRKNRKISRNLIQWSQKLEIDHKYFRFNVQGASNIGLAEWDKIEDIIALTEDYIREGDVRLQMEAALKLIDGKGIIRRVARTVWRIARPLAASWNIFNPSRDKVALQHWGVVVASFEKPDLDRKIRVWKKMKNEYLGEIHELQRDGNKAIYGFREWKSEDVAKKTVITYVGQTTLTDDEIMKKGTIPMKLTDDRLGYNLQIS
jgi:hypothetical protein